MVFAEPGFGARLVCIDGTGADPRHLRATLGDVLRGTAYAASIRVHAREPLTDLPPDPRVEWLPPVAGGLVGALRLLPPAAGDVLFVAAGVRVPAAWDARLAAAAAIDEHVGCVSPLCAGLPPFAAGRGGQVPPAEDVARLDGLVAERGAGQHIQFTTFLPVCVYLRAAAVEALRAAGEASVRSIERAGLVSLLATNLLVSREDAGAAQEALGAYADEARSHARRLAWLRETVAKELRQPAGPPRRPVQLHVAHSWGGGLGHWVDDFIRGDADRDNLVLKSIGTWGAFGQRIELHAAYADTTPIRAWTLGNPIAATAPAHLEYRALLQEIVADYGVEAILVSSLVGHSLDALRTGLPTLLVAHDHYPFCVALYAYFDGVCEACDGDRLRRCLADNPYHAYFHGTDAEDWEALRRCFVATVRASPLMIVAPGRSVLERWRSQMPGLAGVPGRVVPHGVDLPASDPLAGSDGDRLRVALLGSLSAAKGLALLEETLADLAQVADVFLLGCGEPGRRFEGRRGVTVIRRYARGELAGHLAAIRPHLGLLLSTVPETYSYTLSELWHFGIPVLATRVGSFLDRIEEGRNGFLFDPRGDALLAAVRAIDGDRGRLAAVREGLRHQAGRDLGAMTRDYHALLPLPAGRPAARSTLRAPARLAGVVHVSPTATYAEALGAFVRYTLAKLQASPRLPAWLRAFVVAALRARRSLADRLRGLRA